MKKNISRLIVGIDIRSQTLKRSSKTINNYVNRIPCNKQQLNKPSEASLFVQQQMNFYPSKNLSSKRQQLLHQRIKIQLKKYRNTFNQLIAKLEDRLNYFDLQQLRYLLTRMGQRQITENKTGLKKLTNVVNYFLESSSENVHIEDHIIESAKELLKSIKQTQKKKVHFIV